MLLVSSDPRSVTFFRDASFLARLRTTSTAKRILAGLAFAFTLLLAAVGVSLGEDPDSYAPYVFCAPAVTAVLWLIIIVAMHGFTGLTKLTITLSPDKIVEQLHGKAHAHPWSWLTRFHDERTRIILVFGKGGVKHRLVFDKRRNGPALTKTVLRMFAEHASSDAGVFAGQTPRLSPQVAPRPNPRDLN